MNELSTNDKLALIAMWRRGERQETLLFGGLFMAGLLLTLYGSHLPQLTGIKNTDLTSLLLGTATLPKAGEQLWKRFKAIRVLSFLTQAYSQNVALAHADEVFANRLKQAPELNS